MDWPSFFGGLLVGSILSGGPADAAGPTCAPNAAATAWHARAGQELAWSGLVGDGSHVARLWVGEADWALTFTDTVGTTCMVAFGTDPEFARPAPPAPAQGRGVPAYLGGL